METFTASCRKPIPCAWKNELPPVRRCANVVACGKFTRRMGTYDNRPDPVDLLIENSQGRMEDLIPIRYGRMAASPFAFYRGRGGDDPASDLSHTPSTGLNILIWRRCHLLNFGGYATTERRLIFDINELDEVAIGPWEWDVKRLTASFVIAGQSDGLKKADCRRGCVTGSAELPPAHGGLCGRDRAAGLVRCLRPERDHCQHTK